MKRRAVVIGVCAAVTAGCTDRLHDVAASTPGDIDVRSRYINEDPLVESHRLDTRPAGTETHVLSFRSAESANGTLSSDADDARTFVSETAFVDDGGRAVLVLVQRLASPGIDVRLGSVSRIGDRALRVGVDEVGTPIDEEPTVHTLLVRLVDERGPPERITVSVEGDRVSVSV